jgi:hypothetical protein
LASHDAEKSITFIRYEIETDFLVVAYILFLCGFKSELAKQNIKLACIFHKQVYVFDGSFCWALRIWLTTIYYTGLMQFDLGKGSFMEISQSIASRIYNHNWELFADIGSFIHYGRFVLLESK